MSKIFTKVSISNIGGVDSIKLSNGSVSAPSLAFTNSPTTGFYSVSNDLNVTLNGTNYMALTTTLATLELPTVIDSTSTTALVVRKNGATGDILVVDTSTPRITSGAQLVLPDGSASAPGLRFADTDTGLYASVAGAIDFTNNGTQRLQLTANGDLILTSGGRGQLRSDYVGTFEIFNSVASQNMKISCNGTGGYIEFGERTGWAFFRKSDSKFYTDLFRIYENTGTTPYLTINTSTPLVTLAASLVLPNGSASAPGLRFADTDTGIYASTAGSIDFTNNGSQRLQFNASGDIVFTTNSRGLLSNQYVGTFIISQGVSNQQLNLRKVNDGGGITMSTDNGTSNFATFQSAGTTFQCSLVIDATATEALLIRSDGDTGDIFTVNTTAPLITAGANIAAPKGTYHDPAFQLGSTTDGLSMVSTINTSWATATQPTGTAGTNWQRIIWIEAEATFVMCGDNLGSGGGEQDTAYLAYSTNGTTWTKSTLTSAATALNCRGLAYSTSLGRVVAVGYNSTTNALYSDDGGINWTGVASAMATNTWTDLAYSPTLNLFAAVSSDGTNRVATSPDGITWTARSSAAVRGYTGIFWDSTNLLFISYNPNTGTTDSIMTSSDGITWTNRTQPGGLITAGCHSPELGFSILITSTPSVFKSTNGTTWTTLVSDIGYSSDGMYEVEWTGDMFIGFPVVAVPGTYFFSKDGTNWSSATYTSSAWSDIAYSSSLERFAMVSITPALANTTVNRTPSLISSNLNTYDDSSQSNWFPLLYNVTTGELKRASYQQYYNNALTITVTGAASVNNVNVLGVNVYWVNLTGTGPYTYTIQNLSAGYDGQQLFIGKPNSNGDNKALTIKNSDTTNGGKVIFLPAGADKTIGGTAIAGVMLCYFATSGRWVGAYGP